MAMTKIYYYLNYHWYRYNTGMGDNDTLWSKRAFNTASEAIAERNKLINCLALAIRDKQQELEEEYFDGDGYFVTHTPFITKETVVIERID